MYTHSTLLEVDLFRKTNGKDDDHTASYFVTQCEDGPNKGKWEASCKEGGNSPCTYHNTVEECVADLVKWANENNDKVGYWYP